jgi:predicted RNase H-like HicB family nuclease
MRLTPIIERLENGEYRASFSEMPSIHFTGATPAKAGDRLERLMHALESPNIRIDQILPDGDVVLVLDRQDDQEELETESGGEVVPFPSDYLHLEMVG